jgi:catechol 2,3-dioxygenase-like lactoylglutathione lyase family enzyme
MRLLEIHIEVADLEKSLQLYSKLITHKRVEQWDDKGAVALVLEDGSAFGLWKKGKLGIHNGRGGEHLHFAFQIMPDEYDHYVSLIKSLGLQPLHHVWPTGHKSVYFFDYDNNQGEFMTTDWS